MIDTTVLGTQLVQAPQPCITYFIAHSMLFFCWKPQVCNCSSQSRSHLHRIQRPIPVDQYWLRGTSVVLQLIPALKSAQPNRNISVRVNPHQCFSMTTSTSGPRWSDLTLLQYGDTWANNDCHTTGAMRHLAACPTAPPRYFQAL